MRTFLVTFSTSYQVVAVDKTDARNRVQIWEDDPDDPRIHAGGGDVAAGSRQILVNDIND